MVDYRITWTHAIEDPTPLTPLIRGEFGGPNAPYQGEFGGSNPPHPPYQGGIWEFRD